MNCARYHRIGWVALFFTFWPLGILAQTKKIEVANELPPPSFERPMLEPDGLQPRRDPPHWSLFFRLRQDILVRTTDDFSFFVDGQTSSDDLKIVSYVGLLGFEIEHASGWAFELDGGFEHTYHTNLFKDQIEKYFLSGVSRLNYHFLSADRKLDFYPSLGVFVTINDGFTDWRWQGLAALGFAWHFLPGSLFLFTEPGFSADFSGNHAWHFGFGLGLEF